jgi:hypothetical protein
MQWRIWITEMFSEGDSLLSNSSELTLKRARTTKYGKEDTMRVVGFLSISVLVLAVLPATAQWPEVTIQDIQFLEAPDSAADASSMLGDTVVVEGVVMGHARSLWGGARWGMMIADPTGGGGPWSGVQIIQHDTTEAGTNITAVQEGLTVKFTGLVEEFSYNPNARAATQVALLVNPPVPIEFTGTADIPEPDIVTCEDLSTIPLGEQWEEVLVKIENARMINNDLGSGQALIEDDTGFQLTVEDWYNTMRDSLAAGLYEYPPNGSQFDITGFVRDLPAATGYAIAPRSSGDFDLAALAPVFEDVVREPTVPSSSDPAMVNARIYDQDGTIENASLWYSVGTRQFTEVEMTDEGDSMYSATIPAQAHGSIVTYYLSATDNAANEITYPDTSSFFSIYHVLDEGFGIYHTQWTPYGEGDFASGSPYEGYTVTVTGIVMSDTLFGSLYFIQDSDEPWHGINVEDAFTFPNPGDEVQVTGLVEEYFDLTRITPADPSTDVLVLSTGNDVFDPIPVATGDIATEAGLMAEAYEDVLVRVEDVIVSTPFPDAPGNYGEFAVDDGSGEVRVDDLSGVFDGNNDSTYTQGMELNFVQGFLWFSFSNFKLQPRNDDDVEEGTGASDQPGLPIGLTLMPARPNPGSDNFAVTYALPVDAKIRLTVFDLAGRRISSLFEGPQTAGRHEILWNSRDSSGKSVSAGTYVIRLRADNKTRSERIIVLR